MSTYDCPKCGGYREHTDWCNALQDAIEEIEGLATRDREEREEQRRLVNSSITLLTQLRKAYVNTLFNISDMPTDYIKEHGPMTLPEQTVMTGMVTYSSMIMQGVISKLDEVIGKLGNG